ncbi:MAG: glycosyltransferase family 9 protein [Candidatus Woesearchaeota archaeon]
MSVKSIKILDKYIGTLVCLKLGILNKIFFRKKLKGVNRILVIQLWGIGETILTLPAIKALREQYNDSEVDILTTRRAKDVFEGQGFFDNLIVIETNFLSILGFVSKNYRKYSLVVDFEEYLNISSIISFFVGKFRIGYDNRIRGMTLSKSVSYNDKQHVVETHLDLIRLIGYEGTVLNLERLMYGDKDKKYIESLLNDNKVSKNDFLVGLFAGAAESAKSRMWMKERFAELGDRLIDEKNTKIVLLGSSDDIKLNDEIIRLVKNKGKIVNLAGKTSLQQLFYLEERCDLIISNDSGPMHIGAAMGTKTIGLFGPNLPVRWRPFQKDSVGLYKGEICEFSPCINVHLGQVPECLQSGHNNICMKNIKVDDIMKHTENLKS